MPYSLLRSMAAALAFSTASLAAADSKLEAIPFAEIDGQTLRLDLYLPKGETPQPLLVWIHGGAWRAGSRANPSILPLVERGWAVASVDYRLSGTARFPAQIHDIKAAIRFLRAKSSDYGYDARKIAIIGSSAGGHLAALAGVTNGVAALEGEIGTNLDQSSDIQAIVSYYGASDLTSILKQSTPHGLSVRIPALDLFLGDDSAAFFEIARLASPVFHIDPRDPPLLMLHGDQDPQMPINQSIQLLGAYRQHGLDVTFEPVHGGGHGGEGFFNEARIERVDAFLTQRLKAR